MTEVFCLLAAGKSERSQSKFHKTLLPAGKKAILSHILETIPEAWEIVVVLGHQADLVRDYCLLAHPERRFQFVIDPHFGAGPGASLLHARELLQRPFVFGCCDSVITTPFHAVKGNWLALALTDCPADYSTAQVEGGRIRHVMDKSPDGYDWAFTGLARIEDHADFWRILALGQQWGDDSLITTFMGTFRHRFAPLFVEWSDDLGIPARYQRFREQCEPSGVLEKDLDELTYHVGDRCIKLYLDPEKRRCKLLRWVALRGVLPEVVNTGTVGFAYHWAAGASLYCSSDAERWVACWDWLQKNLWSRPVALSRETFHAASLKFYKGKTGERLQQLDKQAQGCLLDTDMEINGRRCRPLPGLYQQVDWEWLAEGVPSPFHGDLHPDNIIVMTEGEFRLIDWRDSFGGEVSGGDLYYDLAKMYSGLLVNYHRALTEEPVLYSDGFAVTFEPFRAPHLDRVREAYEEWLAQHGYDLYRVKHLAALIHLNIAPLHTPVLRNLLLFQGWRSLDELLPLP